MRAAAPFLLTAHTAPRLLRRQMSAAQTTITYGAGDAKATYELKKHQDIFIDDIGIGKLTGIVIKGGKLPVVLEDGTAMMVKSELIRPKASLNAYDLKRFLNIIENARKLKDLGLDGPAKKATKPPGSCKRPKESPKTDRVTRQKSSHGSVPASFPPRRLSRRRPSL